MKLKQNAISKSNVSVISAISGTALFTVLLWLGKIGEASYIILLGLLAIVSLILYDYSRVREIDIKNLKMTLDPVAEIKPGSYIDDITGNKVEISVSPYYSIVKVNDREYYFIRKTGKFDHIGLNVD